VPRAAISRILGAVHPAPRTDMPRLATAGLAGPGTGPGCQAAAAASTRRSSHEGHGKRATGMSWPAGGQPRGGTRAGSYRAVSAAARQPGLDARLRGSGFMVTETGRL